MFSCRRYFLTWSWFLCLLRRQLVGVILFYLSGPAGALEQCVAGDYSEPFHICYFSLNNEKEFVEMQKFTNKINQYTYELVSVQEYLTEGELPEESFKKMVESGVRCDGLVISGHHTVAFEGKRSSGSLSIDFLETLSCDPKYSKWFTRVNALWLQGCRTLGTGEIIIEEEISAGYHTMQVEEVLEEEQVEQSIAQLNIEFLATLDQDNPFSSRYLRIFPRATVFGWTKLAPGEKAGSEYSIPFHMAHISKLIDNQDAFPSDSPIQGTWTEKSTLRYLNSMIGVLDGAEKCQDLAVEAWREHGRVHDQDTEYGFYNPALNAYKPLTETDGTILKTAHVYDCLFKNSQGHTFLKVLDEILKEPILIRYTYNSLLERLKTLKEEEPHFYTQTVKKLREHSVIQDFLSKKLDDKSLGLLRKIDYLAFYEEIYGPTQKITPTVLEKASEAFSTISSENLDGLYYKRTLLSSLSKHGYLNNDQGLKLIQQVTKDPKREMSTFAMEVAGDLGKPAFFILEEGFLNKNAHVRAVALKQMSHSLEEGALLPFVEKGMADKHVYVRAVAMGSAHKLGEKTLPFIERGFSDEAQWVRAVAMRSSLTVGKKALPVLQKALATEEGKKTLINLPKAKALAMLKQAMDKHKDKEFQNYIQSLLSYVETNKRE